MEYSLLHKKLHKLCPLVFEAEKKGCGIKIGTVEGKYIVGYKIAREVRRQHKLFMQIATGKPAEGRVYFEKYFKVDHTNPYKLIW